MFATFRKEARDGGIVCISNTSLPPVSGSQLHHFACDRCRAKKVSRPREFYDLSITGNTMGT